MKSKKITLITGLLIGLGAAVAVFGRGIWQKTTLDDSSGEAALQIAEATFSSLSIESLYQQAHPSLEENDSLLVLESLLSLGRSRLGEWRGMNEMSGAAKVPLLAIAYENVPAAYSLEGQYSEGTARIDLELIHTRGRWLISRIDLSSEQLPLP